MVEIKENLDFERRINDARNIPPDLLLRIDWQVMRALEAHLAFAQAFDVRRKQEEAAAKRMRRVA